MEKQLVVSDLQERVFCEIEIGLSQLSLDIDNEQFLGSLEKSTKKTAFLGADDIKKRFSVSDDVAQKVAGFQYDIHAKFLESLEKTFEVSGRYLEVQSYLNDKRYSDSILQEYVYRNPSQKELSPKNNLYKSIMNICVSIIILGAIAASVRTLRIPFDPTGGWILATIWMGFTALAAIRIPKDYRTRALLASIKKASK
jgi:hypothetical protein